MHDNEGDLGNLELDDTAAVKQLQKPSYTPHIILLVLLLGAGAAAIYYFLFAQQPPATTLDAATPIPVPTARPTPAPTPAPDALVQTRPPQPTPAPLPNLNASDNNVRQQLTDKLQLAAMAKLLTPEEIVRKFVRATYNLGQGKIVPQYRPLNGPNSAFKAQAIGRMAQVAAPNPEDGVIQTAVFKNPGSNQQRYAIYAKLADTLDTDAVISTYQTYYPLLQQAYGELGEGPAQFHTVVLKALDSFLTTPELSAEPELILTSVQYQFLDPQLEALPSTQKLMLRMGAENRQRVMTKLDELKLALLAVSPKG